MLDQDNLMPLGLFRLIVLSTQPKSSWLLSRKLKFHCIGRLAQFLNSVSFKMLPVMFCILFEAWFIILLFLFLFVSFSLIFAFILVFWPFFFSSSYPPFSAFSFPCFSSQDSMCGPLFSVFSVLFSVYFLV